MGVSNEDLYKRSPTSDCICSMSLVTPKNITRSLKKLRNAGFVEMLILISTLDGMGYLLVSVANWPDSPGTVFYI
jgi:hypothetical protein